MFRYYQRSDYSEWLIGKDTEPTWPWEFARITKAGRVTVLSISADPDITSEDDLKYAGPMYFDIDCSDLMEAILSTRELVGKLEGLGIDPEAIDLRLSGSKGCHVFIPPKLFSSGRPMKNLPAIYKRIATELYVPGLDMVVYSAGKGRMFRPTNAKRPDGNYTVPVSYSELQVLNPDSYRDLVKAPRLSFYTDYEIGETKAAGFSELFQDLRTSYASLESKTAGISDDLVEKIKAQAPPCIELLASGKEKDSTAFNRAAVNVACWTARSGIGEDRLSSLLTRIGENTSSKKYDTALSRKRHLEGLHHYVSTNKSKYKFSCMGMLSVVEGKPCKDCALKNEVGADPSDRGKYESMFVYESLGQYYSDPDFQKPITSFTMQVHAVVKGENSSKIEASVVTINSPISGYTYELPDFSEDAWTSKQRLKQELQGLSGVVFLGSDNDVARLRLTVTKNDLMGLNEMEVKYKHSKVGMHYYRRKGPASPRDSEHVGKAVYVERGFSVDGDGFPDSHVLTSDVPCSPHIRTRPFNAMLPDSVNEVFSLLWKANTPPVSALLFGWFMAYHLKAHLYHIERRFPLLYVSGVAGVGKNSLIAVWMRLAGLEGADAQYTLEAPNSTKLPFQQGVSNSVTIPRVINEFNPKSMSRMQYTTITELLKAAYDSQTISKGRIGGGDRYGVNVSSVDWTITAPLITLSEEIITSPALLQRGIRVELTPQGLQQGSDAFYDLEYRADDLVPIAVRLISSALKGKMSNIIQRLDSTTLPDAIAKSKTPERLKFGYRIMLMAYDWAYDSLEHSGLSKENLEEIKKHKQIMMTTLISNVDEIQTKAGITEIDKVMTDMAFLAYSHADANASYKIESPRHYLVMGDSLFLDVAGSFPTFLRYRNSIRESVVYRTEEAFKSAVMAASYLKTVTAYCPYMPTTKGRPVYEFSLEGMAKAGIAVTMFKSLESDN